MRKIIIGLIVAAMCLVASAASPDTRGLRNNNAGNIIKTDTKWAGEIECSDPNFECFSSAHYGIRAMAIILYTYRYVYGYDNIIDVLYRWMPPVENPTQDIVLNVTSAVCSKYRSLSMVDMIQLIILIENGVQPYSVSEIVNALPSGNYNSARFDCNRVNT